VVARKKVKKALLTGNSRSDSAVEDIAARVELKLKRWRSAAPRFRYKYWLRRIQMSDTLSLDGSSIMIAAAAAAYCLPIRDVKKRRKIDKAKESKRIMIV
jgi:hypothetical protein